MFGRDAPRRSARLSPPGAGAPSGAAVAKGDIAPVAKEPDFRTPGKSLANRAPWRSPGAALRDRDRENNYVSARKKAVRKLSARSPATAAMASGAKRNGRPRFTPAEMRTPSVTPSKNPSTEDDDDHDDREDETKTTTTEEPRQERTPLADLASVPITTVLLTPPSTRSRSRAAEADNNAKAAAASEADAKAAMPPPPPKPRVSPLANVTTNPFLDDEATMKVPALAPYNAAFEALQMGTASQAFTRDDDEHDDDDDDDDDDDAEAEEPAGQRDAEPSASPALSLFAPTEVGDDSVLIADADANGSFFGGDRSMDDGSMNLENGDDDLPTPTTTSAFDAALDIAAATVAIPAFSAVTPGEPTSKTPARTPSRDILNPNRGEISANEISTGFLGPAALVAAGSTLKEMLAEAAELAAPDDDAEEDPTLGPTLGQPAADPDAESSRLGGGQSESPGGRVPAGAVLDAIAHPHAHRPPSSESAAVFAASPIAALSPPTLEPEPAPMEEDDASFAKNAFDESPPRSQPAATPSPVRRSPRLAAMRTASVFTPASPAVVETDAAPTAAERRAAELQALVERQAVELLEQREALERQRMMMRSEASRQAAQLEAQREAMMNQKRQMENEAALAFQRAEAAAREQARMRAEFQAQLEARRAEEDATRARLAAMASEAAAAKEEAARAARAAAEAAEAARRQPPAASPFPLGAVKSVEDELRACREELARRSAESAAVSQRMQTLQREETELFNRAAELQRRMLEMVIKGNPKISPAAAAALAQPLISSVSSGAASGASAMPPPPARMMDMDLSLARPVEVVDAIAAAAEMMLQPRQPMTSMNNSPAMVSMDSLAAAAATPGTRGPAPSLAPLASMSAGVARAMEAAVAPSVVDEDGFIVMDYAAAGASMPIADAAKIGNDGNGVFMTPAITPPAARALEMAAAAADTCPALVMTPTSASKRGGSVGNPAAAGIATRRNALQILELRKEVVNLQFLGGHESGTSAGMLMAATKDGAVRLFAPGSRRAAAMIRGPKQGLAAAVAVGTEAFIAAAGRDAHVARHDLATGRELGILLPSIDDGVSPGGSGPELTCIRGGGATGGPVVVAAGEGGDVYLWDVRAAPRVASRRASGVGGAATPAMTMHVPGASRTLSLSLSDALGGGAHGTAPASLALVASNGGRVFDLRAPGRPARLAPAEAGQRWVACAHAGRSDDVLTLSSQGDLATWRPMGGGSGGFNYRIAGPVLREVASANSARAVLSTSGPIGGVDVDGVMALTTTGETGDGFRVFDASTGDVVAEWGGDGERTDAGVGATAGFSRGWRRSERDEPRPSITAAGWGCGALDGAFGGSSFAVGTSDGVVRVYGPGA